MRLIARGIVRAMVCLVLCLGSALAQDRADGPSALGTMAPGTISHATGTAIASLVSGTDGMELRVVPYSGEALLLQLLAAGEIDFAIVNAAEALASDDPGLRVAAVLYPLQVGLLAAVDGDVQDMSDLRAQRVTTGFATSVGVARLLDAALAAGNLSTAEIDPVRVSDLLGGAERFMDRRADVFFFALGAAKLIEVNATRPIRLLPMPDDADALARVQAIVPAAYLAPIAPRPGLVGVAAPTMALTFDNLLVTRSDMSAHRVTAMLDGLAANRQALVDRVAAFRGRDPGQQGNAVPGLVRHHATEAWQAP